MDKERAESEAEALIARMRDKQRAATDVVATRSKALKWVGVLMLGVFGAVVGMVGGMARNHGFAGLILGFLGGITIGALETTRPKRR